MTAGTAASAAFAIVCFAGVAALPGTALAKSSVTPPSSIGRDVQSWTSQDGWHLRLGAVQRDTLDASPSAALLAAKAALENDKWECEWSWYGGPHLTTQWKAIHNLFMRVFTGKAFGRCFVSVRPLSDAQVEVTFQGGLAARGDIEHSPLRGSVERSYLTAAHDWQRDVRELVADRSGGREHAGGGAR
jgi:hypothetical protein